MSNITFKFYKNNWKENIFLSIIFTFSFTIISAFLGLLINIEISSIKNFEILTLIIGVTFFQNVLLISSIFVTLSLLIFNKVKTNEYIKYQNLGINVTKIKSMVIKEKTLTLIPTLILGVGLGYFLNHFITQTFINDLLISSSVNNTYTWYHIILAFLFGWLFFWITILIANLSIKNLYKYKQNNFNLEKINKKDIIIWAILLCFLIPQIIVLSLPFALQTYSGMGMMFNALLAFTITMCLWLKISLTIIAKKISLSSKSFFKFISFKNIEAYLSKMFLPIMIFIMFFETCMYQIMSLNINSGYSSNSANSIVAISSTIMALMMIFYALAVSINSFLIYSIERKKINYDFRILGFSNKKIKLILLVEFAFVVITVIILGFIPSFIFEMNYLLQNSLSISNIFSPILTSILFIAITCLIGGLYLTMIKDINTDNFKK